MIASKYDDDKKLEEFFGEWLDDNFYEELAKQELILGWYRVNGEKLQKKGKDVIVVKTLSEEIIIDEKATLQYINKDLPTFAFEIKNQTSGAKGWLYNNSLETQYYLLAWPHSICDKNGTAIVTKSTDFTRSDVMLIKKANIIKLLEEQNLTEEIIQNKINEFSKKANPNNHIFSVSPGISLNFNFSLHERPINIVIKRTLLEKKANFFGQIGEACPSCGNKLVEKIGQHGLFIGCSNYPKCRYTRKKISM